jgi:hypothetical protein
MFNRTFHYYSRLPPTSFDAANGQRPLLDTLDLQLEEGPATYKFEYYPSIRQSWNARVQLSWYRFCGRTGPFGRLRRILLRVILVVILIILALLIVTPIWNPSYTYKPKHYTGTNPRSEKVFIAANIIDKDLIRGAWGDAILGLIDIIGPQNAFLSIYENDSGPETKEALRELAAKVKCEFEHETRKLSQLITSAGEKSISSGHIDLDKFPTVQILPNERRIKRVTYLAEVRNHALQPLELLHRTASQFPDEITTSNVTHSAFIVGNAMKFDKLLFLNDVVFEPRDAADLLFATNIGPDGRTRYHATCAMDHINAFKFYDRFAMRDNQLNQVGLPFFPWFTPGGESAQSFRDVMAGSDAVRVTSCWGGMVAFEAKWFQKHQIKHGLDPLRFRSEPDVFWDASECCLIHADLQHLVQQTHGKGVNADIFVNPFVRVAYDVKSFAWLGFVKRFERLFTVPHVVIGWFLGMPWFSSRKFEMLGDEMARKEWVYTGPVGNHDSKTKPGLGDVHKFGKWETVKRTAKPGGYCGYPLLLALKNSWGLEERKWEKIEAPLGFD